MTSHSPSPTNLLDSADSRWNAALESATSVEHLRELLTTKVPAPGRIDNVSVFCNGDTPDRLLVLIDIAGIAAGTVAQAVEGQLFGFTSVVQSIPVQPKFSCRIRQAGGLPEGNCACRIGQQDRPSLLDSYD